MATTTATKKKKAIGGRTQLVEKIDLKKQLKELYRPSARKVALVDVPAMNFLMINGSGYPQEEAGDFQAAIESLYGVAYTLKFMLKQEGAKIDYTVMPLESLWWIKGGGAFKTARKSDWRWTLMVAQPPHITEADVKRAMRELKARKDPPFLSKIRFRQFDEGKAVQLMHIGPWSEEEANIDRLHSFAHENGLKLRGRHHEIYMSDPRRTAPEKLKTVIRQPVR